MDQSVLPRFMQGRQLLKTALFVGGSVLAAASSCSRTKSVSRLQHEVSTTSQLLAEFSAQASIPAARDPQLKRIFADLIQNIDFPIIITDTLGNPARVAWHRHGNPRWSRPSAGQPLAAPGRLVGDHGSA